jgi:hypothetical protein
MWYPNARYSVNTKRFELMTVETLKSLEKASVLSATSELSKHALASTIEKPSSRFDAVAASKIINHTIELAAELPDNEIGAKLEKLVGCSLRLHLERLAASDTLDVFMKSVPAAQEFVDELHEIAETVLHEVTLDADSSIVVHNIAIAADIAQDRNLLEELASALEGTNDYGLMLQKHACEIALQEHRPYMAVYHELKRPTPQPQPTYTRIPGEYFNPPLFERTDYLNVGSEAKQVNMDNFYDNDKTFPVRVDQDYDLRRDPQALAELQHRLRVE